MKSEYCTIEKSNVDTSEIFNDEENKILNELNLYNNSEIKNYVNNIDDISEINKTLLLILNYGDVEVNELGTIAVYFSLDDYSLYSNLNTADIYNIKLENKLESNSITMPIKIGYSCTYEYNGTPVFDESGKLNARSYVILKKNINNKYLILNLTCK